MEALDMSKHFDKVSSSGRRIADILDERLPIEVSSIQVTGMTHDSRAVTPGMLFIALAGTLHDGRAYIDQAISLGACIVFAESQDDLQIEQQDDVYVLLIPALREKVSAIAAKFYNEPSKNMAVVGITGTNGKTTCSHMIASLLGQCNYQTALMGTLGYGLIGEPLTQTGYTTPDAIQTQKCLADLYAAQSNLVAMEVSSHALVQGRVNAVEFKTAVFTNLSRDHLDFHETMKNYGLAKEKLFSFASLENAVVNLDDEFGRQLVDKLAGRLALLTYSIQNQQADVYARQVVYTLQGVNADIHTPWGEFSISLPLLGEFNLSNFLAAAACALVLGNEDALIGQSLTLDICVEGRMQIYNYNGASIIVDYAHTPDALQRALQAVRLHATNNVVCVFGCGGERDQGKRAEMARVSGRHADQVIVTSDNPRNEPAENIIDDILLGFEDMGRVIIESDRREAILKAIKLLLPGDIALIAGKGHEDYQQLGDQMLPFSDGVVIKECIASLRQDEGVSP